MNSLIDSVANGFRSTMINPRSSIPWSINVASSAKSKAQSARSMRTGLTIPGHAINHHAQRESEISGEAQSVFTKGHYDGFLLGASTQERFLHLWTVFGLMS